MIVVTGGAGFIGSNVVAALDEDGRGSITVCDRLGSGEKWRNIAKREIADLVPPEDLFEYLGAERASIETVVHMGAVSATTENDVDLIVAIPKALPRKRAVTAHHGPELLVHAIVTPEKPLSM